MTTTTETHASELNATCALAVALKRQGKYDPDVPTAMLRGLVAGEVLRRLHESDFKVEIATAVNTALLTVTAELQQQGRRVTDGAENSIAEMVREIGKMATHYLRRFKDYFARCRLIGCELPMRVRIGDHDFATHLDLLYRNPSDDLCLVDWKYHKTCPSFHYLARWPQGILMCLACAEGVVGLNQTENTRDDNWLYMPLDEWPRLAWCHLPNLKPYARKTTRKDDNGQEVTFNPGDDRPDSAVMRWIDYQPGRRDEMAAWIVRCAEVYADEFPPASPSPDGCDYCECRRFCPTFDSME
jgi:hypothetical protein